MKIIREQIRLDGNNKSIKFSLLNNNDLLGLDQDVSNLITYETDKNTNVPVDNDLKIYTAISANTLSFSFFTTAYTTSFIDLGFEQSDVYNDFGKKSFFIADTYTTYKLENQQKLSQNYINNIKHSGTTYTILNKQFENREFYHWYVSDNLFTGSTTIITAYTKFSFFNAKTGNISVFFNKNNEYLNSELKMYITTYMDILNKTYWFEQTNLNLYELVNESYRQKIQRSLSVSPNKAAITPSGTIFDITSSGISYK